VFLRINHHHLDAAAVNDTTPNGWNYFDVALPTPLSIAAGGEFICTFGFIPGYTWNANTDTLNNKNRLRFVSYEENGDNGGAGTYPSYTKWDWNCSFIQDDDDLYEGTPFIYTSTYSYNADYGYEHHWVEFLLTGTNISVGETVNNIATVKQNYPNPFEGTTTVDYALSESANVSVQVFNLTGAKVLDLNEGTKSAGSHNLTIDASNLDAGVYYYTFTANNSVITKKMVVL